MSLTGPACMSGLSQVKWRFAKGFAVPRTHFYSFSSKAEALQNGLIRAGDLGM